ncbi:MAG: hypothetical protein Q9163_003075 [Psora crenata]
MSYDPLSHTDTVVSESDYSDIQASLLASRTMSPCLELQSLHSESLTRPRTVSRDGSGPMRHPTPDLQSLQGAYLSNIERLEQSAERLSMSSDIGEEIRKMREEQKLSDSRRSSILNPHLGKGDGSPTSRRQLSYGYGSFASNSIAGMNNVPRSGGFPPAAYFATSMGSVRSGSGSNHNSVKGMSASQEPRLTLVSEPEQEGKPLDSPMSTRITSLMPPPDSGEHALRITNDEQYNLNEVVIPKSESPEPEVDEEQPMPTADASEPRPSIDTARQRDSLFLDFDGVHTVAQPPELPPQEELLGLRRSTQMPNGRPQSYMEPTPGESMVYYPAPVPMMLNLPKRLSKMPATTQKDKKRAEMLSNIPTESRKSAAWLLDMPENPEEQCNSIEGKRRSQRDEQKRRNMADLPPQLRASMFFDYPAAKQDVEVKGESAVATLDSILDASAFAPVSAFTDHPFAGHVGAEVYGRAPTKAGPRNEVPEARKRSSTIDLVSKTDGGSDPPDDSRKRNSLMSIGNSFGKRRVSVSQVDELTPSQDAEVDTAEHHESQGNDYVADNQDDVDEVSQEDGFRPFELQPTTLLAELQMRKQQQKLRNRTAATAFPDGMHSTLLQLDAVAQVQKQARKQRHTTLAWEDPEAHHHGPDSVDDDDVPLGMLYPGQPMQRQYDEEDRPLGLIAQRHMEESEPLSHRRARLRGENPSLQKHDFGQQNFMYSQGNLNLATGDGSEKEDGEEHPGETLAQRIKRIKATQIPTQSRPVSGDFASEIMSQLGELSSSKEPQPPEPTKTEASHINNPAIEEETLGQRRKRLQAEAAARSHVANGHSNGTLPAQPSQLHRRSMADLLQAHPVADGGARSIPNELKFAPAPKMRNTAWAAQVNEQAALAKTRVLNGLGQLTGGGYAPHPMVAGHYRQQKPVEAELRQRDMIDRWRQSRGKVVPYQICNSTKYKQIVKIDSLNRPEVSEPSSAPN